MSHPRDHMTLSILHATTVLDGYRPPSGSFDPNGNWTLLYNVYSLAGAAVGGSGSLQIQRRARGSGGGADLHVEYTKRLSDGYDQVVVGDIACASDALSTPSSWSYSSEVTNGSVFPDTRLEKEGAVVGDTIVIQDKGGSGRHEYDKPAAFSMNWVLFDAVQRLPGAATSPISFTLIDHFDQIKENQTLSFEKEVDVLLGSARMVEYDWEYLEKGRVKKASWGEGGGTEHRMTVYDHLGEGIVPWVYWVDEQGRLLFAVSGIEAYVLQSAQ